MTRRRGRDGGWCWMCLPWTSTRLAVSDSGRERGKDSLLTTWSDAARGGVEREVGEDGESGKIPVLGTGGYRAEVDMAGCAAGQADHDRLAAAGGPQNKGYGWERGTNRDKRDIAPVHRDGRPRLDVLAKQRPSLLFRRCHEAGTTLTAQTTTRFFPTTFVATFF